MRITVTKEMRDALRRHAVYRRQGFFPGRTAQALRLTRLVAEAVEAGEKEAPLDCAFGTDGCPCLEPDMDHVFIHLGKTQIECHACGAVEDIPLPGQPHVLDEMVKKHEPCREKGGGDA